MGSQPVEFIQTGWEPILRQVKAMITHGPIVVFRSAKERPFAERKATIRKRRANRPSSPPIQQQTSPELPSFTQHGRRL